MAKAAQVKTAGGPLEIVDVQPAEPGPGQVRIRVHACGICHSDVFTYTASWPGVTLPRSPGHEIAGTIDALGSGVERWSVGDRVGVGWFGGVDLTCDACRRGDFISCENGKIPGIHFDGGYSQYVNVQAFALARLPEALDFREAAPLMCAGITTFNALRNSGARPGDLVAVQGVGGLGHLAVQYAAKMGFHTVAIARGSEKEKFALQLGAAEYIDGERADVAQSLQKLGGARVILTTVTDGPAMTATLGGLGRDGRLVIVGAAMQPMQVVPVMLISGRKQIGGWPSGTAMDSEDTLAFSAAHGVRAMIEELPLERAQEAFDKMMSGAARFRMVLGLN